MPNEPIEIEFRLEVIDEDETIGLDTVVINSRLYDGLENIITKGSLVLRDDFSDFIAENITVDRNKGIAFITDGKTLRALDISNPLDIKDFGWSINKNFSNSEVFDDLLIAYSWGELWFFDIADINNIKTLSVVPISSTYRDLELKGDILYIASGSIGIKALNIADPISPIELDTSVLNSSLPSGTPWVNGIKILGNLLYATTRIDGLKVFDISDLSQASLAGEMECLCLLSKIETNNNLIVLPVYNKGVILVDINEPTTPKILSITATQSASFGLAINKNLISVGNFQKGIDFLDISNPNIPQWIGKFSDVYDGKSMHLDDDFIFVAEGFTGIKSFEVSTLSLPILTKHELGQAYQLNALTVNDDKLFVSSIDNRLSIFNLAGTEEPQLLGELSIDVANIIKFDNNTLFLASSNGLNIINVLDVEAPQFVSNFPTQNSVYSLTIKGEQAFINDGRYFFKRLNISNIEQPTLMSELSNLGSSNSLVGDIIVNNDHAFVANGEGLVTIDIKSPESMSLLSTYNNDGYTSYSTRQYKEYVYLLDQYKSLKIIDISIPDKPTLVNSIEDIKGEKLKLINDMLYVINPNISISKYSLSNPLKPILMTNYQLTGTAVNIAFYKNKILNIALNQNGYSVLDFDKSLKVGDNNTHLNSSEQYEYNAHWQLDALIKLNCIVSGGECKIINDLENKKAKIIWTAPINPGDHQITILIGNTSFFDSYEDKVIVR